MFNLTHSHDNLQLKFYSIFSHLIDIFRKENKHSVGIAGEISVSCKKAVVTSTAFWQHSIRVLKPFTPFGTTV